MRRPRDRPAAPCGPHLCGPEAAWGRVRVVLPARPRFPSAVVPDVFLGARFHVLSCSSPDVHSHSLTSGSVFSVSVHQQGIIPKWIFKLLRLQEWQPQ